MGIEITTNNVPRDVIYWYDLTDAERQDFDWLDEDSCQADASFFRYRGQVYCIGEFTAAQDIADLEAWHGYAGDSYFSGTLVRYTDDFESVVVGRYYV